MKNPVDPYAHSVPLVGYKMDKKFPGGGYFIFRNSGGVSWGDTGYGYMTFRFVKDYAYDTLYFINDKTVKPVGKIDLNLIEKRFLMRKDILRQNSKRFANVKVKFLKGADLQKVSSLITKN